MLHFRCVKITLEEKQTSRLDGEVTIEKTANLQFDCVEAVEANRGAMAGFSFHGYIGLTLPIKKFEEYGYELGGLYALSPVDVIVKTVGEQVETGPAPTLEHFKEFG